MCGFLPLACALPLMLFFMEKEKIRKEEWNANAAVLQRLSCADMLFASLNTFFF